MPLTTVTTTTVSASVYSCPGQSTSGGGIDKVHSWHDRRDARLGPLNKYQSDASLRINSNKSLIGNIKCRVNEVCTSLMPQ
jgi:hypothetical protein